MRKVVFVFIILSVLTAFESCVSKKPMIQSHTLILPLGDTIHLTDGCLVYGLPMTLFRVEVEAERTIEKSGPYAKFAGEMLGIKNVITQETDKWSIKSVKLRSYEELDPSELYMIESNTLIQTNCLALKKSGLIMDINPAIYEKNEKWANEKLPGIDQIQFLDLGSDEYFQIQSDTAFRIINVDTAFIRIPYLVEKKKQLTVEQLADKAAKSLLELREGKHLILTGEANVYPQSEAAINETNRLEREYTALFTGKRWSETKTFFYTMIPEKELSGKPVIIFRFSETAGPKDVSNGTGNPVIAEFLPSLKTKDLTLVAKPQSTEDPAGQKFDKLFYRIPDVVTINIRYDKQNLYNSRKLIYQFGKVVQLPANFILAK